MRKFTEAEKSEVWDRWQGGEAMRKIARRLGRESSSVRTLIEDTGGVRPVRRRRSLRLGSRCVRSPIGWVGRRRRYAGTWPAMGDEASIGHCELIGRRRGGLSS